MSVKTLTVNVKRQYINDKIQLKEVDRREDTILYVEILSPNELQENLQGCNVNLHMKYHDTSILPPFTLGSLQSGANKLTEVYSESTKALFKGTLLDSRWTNLPPNSCIIEYEVEFISADGYNIYLQKDFFKVI